MPALTVQMGIAQTAPRHARIANAFRWYVANARRIAGTRDDSGGIPLGRSADAGTLIKGEINSISRLTPPSPAASAT
jgi:hypothetical protein